MLKFISAIWFLLALSDGCLFAQARLPLATNIKKAYDKGTHSLSGPPGKGYWQNTADYSINVAFNPLILRINGSVKILYTNNSPDTLKRVVFKLFPNLYQRQAMRATSIAAKDLTDGVDIESIKEDNQFQDSTKRIIRGTNMYLNKQQIAPHQQVQFDISYAYTLIRGRLLERGRLIQALLLSLTFFRGLLFMTI